MTSYDEKSASGRAVRPGERLLEALRDDPVSGSEGRSAADWRTIEREATRHGLGPLLYRRVGGLPPAHAPPSDMVERLRTLYIHSELRNTSVYTELARVLGALRDASLEVIVLKGAYLAEAIYGDVALRPMHDVDLLLRVADIERAWPVFRALGYDGDEPAAPIDGEPTAGRRRHCHFPPITRPGAIPIEVHWTTVGPGPIEPSLEETWAAARPARIAGVPVLALSPAHLLHHLCLHVSCQHRFRVPLLPLHDVAVSTRSLSESDWEEFDRVVEATGSLRWVAVVLAVAERAFPGSVPAARRVWSAGGEGAALVETAWSCLTGPPRRDFPRLFVRMEALSGTRARARFLWAELSRLHERIRARDEPAAGAGRASLHLAAHIAGFVRRRGRLAADVLLRRSTRSSLADAGAWAALDRWLTDAER